MIYKTYKKLLKCLGPQQWWPAETKFEIIVGAILTQQTSWKNVEKAIKNLKERNLLSPESMYALELSELEKTIRPAGFYRMKAKKLKNFLEMLFTKYEGNLNLLLQRPKDELRRELLSVNGIGKETADSIILYAAEKPVFIVDAYTLRLCKRLGIIDSNEYDEVQKVFQDRLPMDKNLLKEFHALIVEFGKKYCRKRPRCKECPLKNDCKHWKAVSKVNKTR